MTLVVWAYTDGKAGHENQTRGLVRALGDRHSLETHWIQPARGARTWLHALAGRYPPGDGLPDPQLHIGAGHGVHLAMLLARRARGGRIVVLMRPSLPRAWFDVCVVPEHDGIAGANIITTQGALNVIVPSKTPGSTQDPQAGLILIGGPSRHYGWSDTGAVQQVTDIVQRDASISWTLTTSRRTPARTLALLQEIAAPNLTVVPYTNTDGLWLPRELARAARVWVSEDSVSMVYEALTAGAATGLIIVTRRHANRISRGMDALVRDQLVTPFPAWHQGAVLAPPALPFNEAARVAAWIRTTWFPER